MNRYINCVAHGLSDGNLLIGEERAALFDCGMAICAKDTIQIVKNALAGRPLDYIIITHAHYDHVGALPFFRKEWPEVRLAASEAGAALLLKETPRKVFREFGGIAAKHLGITFDAGYSDDAFHADVIVKDGDSIPLGGLTVEALETPGHTRDSFSYFIPELELLISNESSGVLMPEGEVIPCYVTSYNDTMSSIKKCRSTHYKFLSLPHRGLVGEKDGKEFFDKAFAANAVCRNFILNMNAKGLSEEDMLELYLDRYGKTLLSNSYQIKDAFVANAKATIECTLRKHMKLHFTKMHGCGNDYIYINSFDRDIDSPESLSVFLSDRHTGVGGDGMVLILRSDIADAKMRMFNYDGSEAGMCGNAIRCVAKYLYDNNMIRKPHMRIETLSGVKDLYLSIKNDLVSSVKVDMGQAKLRPEEVPVNLTGDNVIARPVTIADHAGQDYAVTCVSMGNPHAVVFCENVDTFDMHGIGPLFENHPLFPDRVNAEFVELVGRNHLKMRVWERGSGETQACGTGACASAVAAVLNGYCDTGADIKVQLPGGNLIIHYTDETVFMTGGCVKVFDGTVDV